MEELDDSSFLTSDEIDDLFNDEDEEKDETKSETDNTVSDPEQSTESIQDTTEDDKELKEELGLDTPESVGSNDEDNNNDHEDTPNVNTGSPTIYSSITNILRDEGILDGLDEESLGNVSNASDFNNLINTLVDARFNSRALALEQAMNVGMNPNDLNSYQEGNDILQNAYNVIQEESDEADAMRESLIYQSNILKGYSPERASREVEKSKQAMTDKEDAMEAWQDLQNALHNEQQQMIDNYNYQQQQSYEEQQAFAQDLYNSIHTSDFGMELSNSMRNKVSSNILDKKYIDNDTKQEYTELEKYAAENPKEYLQNVGFLYTVTNGFKNMENLYKGATNKIKNKNVKDLENLLRSSSYDGGNLKYVSNYGNSSTKSNHDWVPDPT